MFGMGTGGSLRLLSPEILFGLDLPSVSALPGLSPSLPGSFGSALLLLRFSPFFASVSGFSAPSKPHRIDLESVSFNGWLSF